MSRWMIVLHAQCTRGWDSGILEWVRALQRVGKIVQRPLYIGEKKHSHMKSDMHILQTLCTKEFLQYREMSMQGLFNKLRGGLKPLLIAVLLLLT